MWRKLLILPGAIAYLLLLYWLFTLAFPFLLDGIGRVRTAVNDAKGTSGLIFVESPEVYTRQRLVNDRYHQDAWLHKKLGEIDAGDSLFIDTVEFSRLLARANLAATAAPGATATAAEVDKTPVSDDGLPEIGTVPFQVRFDLQSAARDKIRQLILENALDDRHDLSGNTVFGLKFDTAVLPGSRAALSPSVVVSMTDDALDMIKGVQEVASMAPHYLRGYAPSDARDAALAEELEELDTYFDNWLDDLSQRLNGHKSESFRQCVAGGGNQDWTQTPLCNGDKVSPFAQAALHAVYAQSHAVEEAFKFVLRMPPRDVSFARDYVADVLSDAAQICQDHAASAAAKPPAPPPEPEKGLRGFLENNPVLGPTLFTGPSVSDLLTQRGELGSRRQDLPKPWGQFIQLSVAERVPGNRVKGCMSLDLQLEGREVPLSFVDNASDTLFEAYSYMGENGWEPTICDSYGCADHALQVWYRTTGFGGSTNSGFNENFRVVDEVLDSDTQGALSEVIFRDVYKTDAAPLRCVQTPTFAADGTSTGEAQVCFPLARFNFRLGSYMFMRQMRKVESYTYAAFPRGDVSGVVRETERQQDLSGNLSGLPALAASLGLSQAEGRRTVQAQPSMINFASGEARERTNGSDSGETFDFGWAIVKDGVKKPMVASQLVLVSVPAYLDELELKLWTGFLDVDRVPFDREEFYNEYELQERIEEIMPSFEEQTLRLKVPPDYSALDGVVFANNLFYGPRINKNKIEGRCFPYQSDGHLTITVPGERLWRSTVVTLDGIKADSIEVMPDMRGILAHFDNAAIQGQDTKDNVLRPRLLEVWTSEDVDDHIVLVGDDPARCGSVAPVIE